MQRQIVGNTNFKVVKDMRILRFFYTLSLVLSLLLTPISTVMASNTLDFEDFKDALTLDANTTLDFGSYNLSISGNGGLSFGHTGGTSFASDVRVGTNTLALTKISTPSDLPTNNPIADYAYSPDNKFMVAVHGAYPCITFFERSGDSYIKVNNPMRYSLEGNGPNIVSSPFSTGCNNTSAEFSSDGNYLLVTGSDGSNGATLVVFKRIGDLFYNLLVPAPYITQYGFFPGIYSASFSDNANYLAAAHAYSPYITIYKRSGDTFTKLPDPAILPHTHGNQTQFSNNGQYLFITHSTSPFLSVYKRSGDTFTKLSNPPVLPTGAGTHISVSPDDKYIAVGQAASPYLIIYKRDGDNFTKVADPTIMPTGTTQRSTFSADGQYLVVAHSVTPYISIYKRSGDAFTKLSNPSVIPTATANTVKFSADGAHLAVGNGGNWETTVAVFYKVAGRSNLNVDGVLSSYNGLKVYGLKSTINTQLEVDGMTNFFRDVSIGTFDRPASLSIRGALAVTGALIIESSATFNGLVKFNQPIEATASAVFKESSTFEKNVFIGGVPKVGSKTAGRIIIEPGQQYVGVSYGSTSPYANRPVVSGTLAEFTLTQDLYNQYVAAGTCPSTGLAPYADCMALVRQSAYDQKYTLIQQTASGFQLALKSQAQYKMEFNWMALEVVQ